MSMITVIRGNGDQAGEPIIDELLTHDAAKIERGRVEIDRATQSDAVTLAVRLDTDYQCGQIVQVEDNALGGQWRGVITGVEHSGDSSPDAETRLTIWRPR